MNIRLPFPLNTPKKLLFLLLVSVPFIIQGRWISTPHQSSLHASAVATSAQGDSPSELPRLRAAGSNPIDLQQFEWTSFDVVVE
ncbi:MAG: hypothetical protein AAF587_42365 [Bacteroidota bacterium]